eukprot:scaffold133301_cov72-Phaeocystis_antarctica.AAC.1
MDKRRPVDFGEAGLALHGAPLEHTEVVQPASHAAPPCRTPHELFFDAVLTQHPRHEVWADLVLAARREARLRRAHVHQT